MMNWDEPELMHETFNKEEQPKTGMYNNVMFNQAPRTKSKNRV